MRQPAALLTASALVVSTIATYEGYRSVSYDDSIGVQTIGFGSTRGVKRGDRIDPVRAVRLLASDTDRVAKEINACLGEVPLTQNEFDAYVSLAYNIGSSAFCRSTLVSKLHETPPDYSGACLQILLWNRAAGRVVEGLVKRRQSEYSQCLKSG